MVAGRGVKKFRVNKYALRINNNNKKKKIIISKLFRGTK